jgi:type II secretory pathway pseudopilin PulG
MSKILASTAGRIIVGLAIILAIVGLLLWFTWDNSAQPKQDARSAEATAETAIDAAQTVIDRSHVDRSIDQLVNETSEAIENETDPKVAGDLARDAICRLLHDSNDPACKLQ